MRETVLYLVEDDDAIARPLVSAMERERFRIDRFVTAEECLGAMRDASPDVVLLDIALPGMSGLDACREIRSRWSVPVIMLTARTEEVDRIVGLELGADDYMTKPFSSRELTARIRAVLRRTRRTEPSRDAVVLGELAVDPETREVRVLGAPVVLTRREFDLLAYLAARAPAVVPRDELMREVWDPHWFGATDTLDVHVHHVRRKIEPDPKHPRFLHTVRGVGYQVRDACAGS